MVCKPFNFTINPIVRFILFFSLIFCEFLIFFIIISPINNESRIMILIPRFSIIDWLRLARPYPKVLIHKFSNGCRHDTVPAVLRVSCFYIGFVSLTLFYHDSSPWFILFFYLLTPKFLALSLVSNLAVSYVLPY